MKIIGITGGIGSGKSTVLNILEEKYHARIIMADDVAKETMEPGQKGYLKTVEMFGKEILKVDQTIDRMLLANIIFEQPNKRIVLNSIIHPIVKSMILNEINRCRISGEYEYVFVEAALLIEDHYETICDEFWYIYVPADIRRERLKQSRGYSDEKINHILDSQLSKEAYEAACSHLIDNSKDIEHTIKQLENLLQM